ncbi:MAG: DUF5696 domain-containing protein [Cellulosilyticaceae bacterium]
MQIRKKWLAYNTGIVFVTVCMMTTGCNLINIGDSEQSAPIEIYRTAELQEGFEKVVENENLELWFDQITAQVAVKDKASGRMWYSNPQDLEDDPIANKTNKNKLKAQLTVVANGPRGDVIEMNSYDYSTSYNQFKFERQTAGIKVTYTIGKQEDIYCLPKILTQTQFEGKILSHMEDGKDKTALINCYKKYDISQLDEKEKKNILTQYPLAETEVIYIIRDEQPEYRLKQISDAVLKAGYTFEDKAADEEANGLGKKQDNPKFNIPLMYTLEGKDLVVSIPMDEVEGTINYPITNIRVLEYFEAAGMEDDGFMMVPDGSGALINFNNHKTKMPSYTGKVYGDDLSVEKKEQLGNTEQVYLPVFGMKYPDASFIAIAEGGDAVASVQADIAGRVNGYNNIYYDFNVIANQKMKIPGKSGDKVISVYQDRKIEEDLKVRYQFIYKEDATYVDMADTYRTYLLDKGMLVKHEVEDIPFVVEYIGAIDKKKHLMGIPVKGIVPMTTYTEAGDITKQLLNGGVSNLHIRYTGMGNEGCAHTVPFKLEAESCLGGAQDLKTFQKFAKEQGIVLYPEFDTQYIHKNELFDGFVSYLDSSRLITKKMAEKITYHSATYSRDPLKPVAVIASPEFALETAEKLGENLNKQGFSGVSVANLGKELNSDFNQNNLIDRGQSKEFNQKQMEAFKTNGLDIMTSGGNQYTFGYTNLITDLPKESSGANILDDNIPFMQIVLHGYIPYTTEPLNAAKDYTHTLLKSIETGSGMYYTWSYASNEITKNSQYSKYYATHYKNWIDEALNTYQKLSNDLGSTAGKKITDHKQIEPGVYCTSYENGVEVFVNYNEKPVMVAGISIDAESYTVKGGE